MEDGWFHVTKVLFRDDFGSLVARVAEFTKMQPVGLRGATP